MAVGASNKFSMVIFHKKCSRCETSRCKYTEVILSWLHRLKGFVKSSTKKCAPTKGKLEEDKLTINSRDEK